MLEKSYIRRLETIVDDGDVALTLRRLAELFGPPTQGPRKFRTDPGIDCLIEQMGVRTEIGDPAIKPQRTADELSGSLTITYPRWGPAVHATPLTVGYIRDAVLSPSQRLQMSSGPGDLTREIDVLGSDNVVDNGDDSVVTARWIAGMNVTLRNVADRAGVSIKTVSRVINRQGEISETTRAHVLNVIQEMDYRPNTMARGLVSGKSAAVALIIPQITDPFFPHVLLGAESVAREHGYSVFLCNTNDNPEQELAYIDMMAGKRVDGVMICGTRLNAAQLEQVARQHRASILSSRNPSGSAVISLPGESGVREVASHLIRLGHRRIGHLGSGPLEENVRERGYVRAMEMHDLPVQPNWVKHIPRLSVETAYRAALELLEATPELTALSCFSDLAAVGALRACAALGRRVPDDLAVVGFDDIELASLVTPALTTMHVPRYEIGKMAMEQLLRVIAADGKLTENIEVDVHLVVRESCGARGMTAVGNSPKDRNAGANGITRTDI